MNTLGDRLKKAIKDANLTQKKVAKALNIPEATLSNLIKNKYEPGIYKIKQLADFLGVDLNWLITGRTFEERLASRPHKKKHPIINNWLLTVNNSHTDNLENCISEIINKLKKMTPNQRKKVLKFINEFILTEDE